MDLITEIADWLDYREWKIRRSLIYLDPKHLRQTQTTLIELGSNLLDFCDFVQDSVRQKYYMLLTKILKRFELCH